MQNIQEQYFVLTLPLQAEAWQKDILEKRFEIHRQIYNALLQKALTRYRQMAQTRAYRNLKEALSRTEDQRERKKLFKERDCLIEKYQLRKYDICRDTTKYRQYFKDHTDSPIVQNLANEVWQAIDSLIHGHAEQVHFKQPGQMKSLAGKTNRSSIKLRGECLVWKGLEIPVRKKKNSQYEEQALSQEIRFCRIKKTMIRGKDRYLLDVILKGQIPLKKIQASASAERSNENVSLVYRDGNVGLDIGFRKLAVVTEDTAAVYDLPEKDRGLEKKKRILLLLLERRLFSANLSVCKLCLPIIT